jgi:hypothetical protein
MNLKALLQEAFVSLTRNWLRSVLTILGISVGIGAFICVVAIGNAGSSKVEDQLQSLGDNFVWIEAGSRARNGMRAGARGSRTLVLNDAHAIVEQVPLIKSMSPNVDGHVQVVYGGENWAIQYRGVTPEFLQIRRWQMRLGTFFTAADVEADVPVCVPSTERHGIGWSLTFPLCQQPTFLLPGRSVPSLCRRSRELSRLSSYGFLLRVMVRATIRLLFQDRFQLQS